MAAARTLAAKKGPTASCWCPHTSSYRHRASLLGKFREASFNLIQSFRGPGTLIGYLASLSSRATRLVEALKARRVFTYWQQQQQHCAAPSSMARGARSVVFHHVCVPRLKALFSEATPPGWPPSSDVSPAESPSLCMQIIFVAGKAIQALLGTAILYKYMAYVRCPMYYFPGIPYAGEHHRIMQCARKVMTQTATSYYEVIRVFGNPPHRRRRDPSLACGCEAEVWCDNRDLPR